MLFFVADPKHQPQTQSHQAYTPCKFRMLQWMTLQTDRTIPPMKLLHPSVHALYEYEEEPSMDNMVEWVQWRAPQLAVPLWMWEELRKCEDVDNVTRTVRAITE